ncbi:MAG: hypothetical protein PHI58_03780 [Candidatus Omnitrophica bacterium]|nr:hypothetical protein [Candidatus Omnitrophota bacterium]
MAENISPEEKLFRIIQKEKAAPATAERPPAFHPPAADWLKKFGETALQWKDRLLNPSKAKKLVLDLQLRTVNIFLTAVLVLLVVSLIYYAVRNYPNTAKVTLATATAQTFLPPEAKSAGQVHSAGDYLNAARQRNIFTATQDAGSVSQDAGAPVQEFDRASLGDLKVQGISWGDVPKVMIQSAKDNKFYILKQGQSVGSTGVKVKTILRNKVVLTAGDKDFEL